MTIEQRALLVIDLQNDYFPDGKFPLWNAADTLAQIEQAIARCQAQGIPVILIQHIASSANAPFFAANTTGVAIHPRILAAAPQAPVVIKSFADSFLNTTLETTLKDLGCTQLLICGMMTQNCVTHTAISKAAEKYQVSVLGDCCSSVSEMIHLIALNGVAPRVTVTNSSPNTSPMPHAPIRHTSAPNRTTRPKRDCKPLV
jgi:nicotinamidase-related amidase